MVIYHQKALSKEEYNEEKLKKNYAKSLEYLDKLCTFAEQGYSVSVAVSNEIREFLTKTQLYESVDQLPEIQS